MSPNSFSILIPCAPTFLLNLSLSLSYSPHFSRKCATVSAASPHSHVGSSMILNRARYLFSEQCPVLRREIHAMCFRFPISWYSCAPCLTFGLLLIFRSWWASSSPCCQDFCHSDLMSFWIAVQRADFRCFEPGRGVVPHAACLASLSTLSFPSIPWCPGIHSMLSENCGFYLMIESVISSMHFMIAWPDWHLGFAVSLMAA